MTLSLFDYYKETTLILPHHDQNVLILNRHQKEREEESVPNELIIVTALSSNHYSEFLDMIGSAHYQLPHTPIIVYDLGLKQHQLNTIKSIKNVHTRLYNFSKYPQYNILFGFLGCYSWKVHIINEISRQYQLLLWLDSSARIIRPIKTCIKHLNTFPIVAGFAHLKNHNMVAFAHNSTISYFNITRESMRGMYGFEANILLIKITNISRFLLDQWVDCAMHHDCICGQGLPPYTCLSLPAGGIVTYNGCHRYDQAALSLIVAKYYGIHQANNVECSNTFLLRRFPTMDWRRYIRTSESSIT